MFRMNGFYYQQFRYIKYILDVYDTDLNIVKGK